MNKEEKRQSLLPLMLVFLLLMGRPAFADGDISVKNWQVDSGLLEDGSLTIVEDINFYFNSDFNGVYREIVLDKTDGIEDLRVEEILPEKRVYQRVDQAENGDQAVYTLEDNGDKINIKLYSPAEYEEKTFRFSYKLLNVGKSYRDVADFNYKFIGDENTSYIENLAIILSLPREKNDQVKIFGHGDRSASLNFKDKTSLEVKASNISAGSMVEVRVLLPPDFLPQAQLASDEDMLDIIIKQEEGYIKDQERSRTIKAKRKKGVNLFSLLGIGGGGLLALYSYLKNRHDLESYEENLRGTMIYLPPAIITVLARMPFDANMLISTIYNLSYKGFIRIEDAGVFSKKHSKKDLDNFRLELVDKDRSKLLAHENFILDWFFRDMGDSRSLTSQDIYNYNRKEASKFHKKFTDWCKLVSKDLEILGLKDNSQRKLGLLTITASLAMLFLSIFNIIIYRSLIKGLILFALFLLLLIFGIELTQRLTDLGHIQYTKLMDFKKDLMKERISINDERLLLVAMALGLGPDKLSSFEDKFKAPSSPNTSWIYWYFLINSSGQSSFAESITSSTGLTDFGSGANFTSGGGGGAGGGGVGGF